MVLQDFLINLAICFLLSFLIGLERQYRRRIMGLRTTILVSVGAFLFVYLGYFSSGLHFAGSTIQVKNDLSRITAAVVSGIGFLGAGVILKDGTKVRGLTTAATLWCDAAVGALCAYGAVIEACVGAGVVLFANIVLRYINRFVNHSNQTKHTLEEYLINVEISSKDLEELKSLVNNFIYDEKLNVYVKNLSINNEKNDTNFELQIAFKQYYHDKFEHTLDLISKRINVKSLNCKKMSDISIDEEEEM